MFCKSLTFSRVHIDEEQRIAEVVHFAIKSEEDAQNVTLLLVGLLQEMSPFSIFHENRTKNIAQYKASLQLGWYFVRMKCCRFGRFEIICFAGTTVEVQIEVRRYAGLFTCPLAFVFMVDETEEVFHIVRYLEAVFTNDLIKQLKPTTPYTRPKFRYQRPTKFRGIQAGVPPPGYSLKLSAWFIYDTRTSTSLAGLARLKRLRL